MCLFKTKFIHNHILLSVYCKIRLDLLWNSISLSSMYKMLHLIHNMFNLYNIYICMHCGGGPLKAGGYIYNMVIKELLHIHIGHDQNELDY